MKRRRLQAAGAFLLATSTMSVFAAAQGALRSASNCLFGARLTIKYSIQQHDHEPRQGFASAQRNLLGGQIESVLEPISTHTARRVDVEVIA